MVPPGERTPPRTPEDRLPLLGGGEELLPPPPPLPTPDAYLEGDWELPVGGARADPWEATEL